MKTERIAETWTAKRWNGTDADEVRLNSLAGGFGEVEVLIGGNHILTLALNDLVELRKFFGRAIKAAGE